MLLMLSITEIHLVLDTFFNKRSYEKIKWKTQHYTEKRQLKS